jgi:hypothetical protein
MICWSSKSQKGVTLSSTEAKYVSISEAVKELKFTYYLLRDIHIKVNLPMVVKTDNIEANFMSENAFTGFRTRHVVHVTTLYKHSSKMVLLRWSSSVQLKMILIYLQRTLSGVHSTVDRYRKGVRDILCNQQFRFTRLEIIHESIKSNQN